MWPPGQSPHTHLHPYGPHLGEVAAYLESQRLEEAKRLEETKVAGTSKVRNLLLLHP